jgi:ferredoxin
MPAITYKLVDGSSRTIDVPAGISAMQAARRHRVPGIVAQCGGALACGTCHVYVDPDWLDRLPTPRAAELQTLGSVAAERKANSRLCCQIIMAAALDGLVVAVPERQVAARIDPGQAAGQGPTIWESSRVEPDEGGWEAAPYNVVWSDGREYGRWRRVLRRHRHGLTVVSRYIAPPGKAWRIIGRAPELGEEVYIMAGAYYDATGRIVARPGTFMFNAPGAVHGGISIDLTLHIHCCGGRPDDIVSIDLIDFEAKEQLEVLT